MTFVTACPTCKQWQYPPDGECLNQCVKSGLATPPLMVMVPGREAEVCRHDRRKRAEHRGLVEQVVVFFCNDCGNEIEPLTRLKTH